MGGAHARCKHGAEPPTDRPSVRASAAAVMAHCASGAPRCAVTGRQASLVVPAKAGTQWLSRTLDPRFRGNDTVGVRNWSAPNQNAGDEAGGPLVSGVPGPPAVPGRPARAIRARSSAAARWSASVAASAAASLPASLLSFIRCR